MCFQAEPIRNSQNEYLRRNKGFAGITCFWTQGRQLVVAGLGAGGWIEKDDTVATCYKGPGNKGNPPIPDTVGFVE